MNAPLRVLIAFNAIALVLVAIVLYRYDLIGGSSHRSQSIEHTPLPAVTDSPTPAPSSVNPQKEQQPAHP